MIRCLATICLSFALITTNVAELHGGVISVVEGDTVTVLDAAKQQQRVRLAGIDAPERG
jgi:endonuclease YncB( thermonuclease family)